MPEESIDVKSRMLKQLDYQIKNPVNPNPNASYILEGFSEMELETIKQYIKSFH